jgi:hypothetical protein
VRSDNVTAQQSESKIRPNPTAASVLKEIERLKSSESDSSSKFGEFAAAQAALALKREYVEDVSELLALQAHTDDVNPGQVSTAGQSGSALTSSWAACVTANDVRLATAEELRQARFRKLRQVCNILPIWVQ